MAIVVFVGLVAMLVVFGVAAVFCRAAVSPRDVSWLAGTATCSSDECFVYERYLVRHRRHRAAGGLFGVAFAVVIGIRYFGSVNVGIGRGSPLADVLFCGVAGVQIGSLSAETFRLGPSATPIAAASLTPHGEYRSPRLKWVPRGLTLAALMIGAVNALVDHELTPLAIALGGLVFTALAEATQAAIGGRRRPVLSEAARDVDARLRSFAGASMALLQIAAAVIVAGWTVSKLPQPDGGFLAAVRFLAVIGCLVVAVAELRRAAPRPPRGWTTALA